MMIVFFFQAEDGIRDYKVTGVQTCALPISTNVDGAGDSDHNDFVAQEATVTASLGSDLRGTLRAGWRYATLSDAAGNVITSGTSYGGGADGGAAPPEGAGVPPGLGAPPRETPRGPGAPPPDRPP